MWEKTRKFLSAVLAVAMIVTVIPVSAFASSEVSVNYRIVHLDCGRKYFSVDAIKALIDNAAAANYNQIQLAFGNDGLRFLLGDENDEAEDAMAISFEASDGTTVNYTHAAVVNLVEAGNKAQNSSGDASWLTEAEMVEIIEYANENDLEVVPLLNLPGHANAILDIASDAYNAKTSDNTLDTSNPDAVEFAMEIFKKYVDFFAEQGCDFFNFGADEYCNDVSGSAFSFSMMSTTEYDDFVTFINSLAAYIKSKDMTPRSFNDGLYYGNWTSVAIDTDIQCCYWSSGWSSYPVASAEYIANKGHKMINTNGDYYYVLKNSNSGSQIVPSNPSAFNNTSFMGSTISNPVGAMFCIWCDYPNYNSWDDDDVITNSAECLAAMGAAMTTDSETVDPEQPDTETKETITDSNSGVTVTAAGASFETISVKRTALDDDRTDGEVSVSYDITLNDGMYTDAAIVKIPYENCFDKCENITGFVEAEDGYDSFEVTVKDGYFICNVPHFSEVTIEADIEAQDEDITTESVNISLTLGESKTVYQTGNTDLTGIYSAGDVAQVNVTYKAGTGTATLNEITSTSNLVDGNSYILVNTRANKVVTDSTATNGFYFGSAASANTEDLWIITSTATEGYYTVQSPSGSYMNISYGGASLSTASHAVQLTYSNNYSCWVIQDGDYYLNNYQGSNSIANGWTDGFSDAGSRWAIYEILPAEGTNTIVFEATEVGESSVTIGNVTYNVTVDYKEESFSMVYGETVDKEQSQVIDGDIDYSGDNVVTAEVSGNTVTFTAGNTAGTAIVTVGDTRYTVTVAELNLDNVADLTVEYWITNSPAVTGTYGTGDDYIDISATQDSIYSEDGVDITNISAAYTYKDGAANAEGRQLKYWHSRLLDKTTNEQTNDTGDDETASGSAFTKIRYWSEGWQVYTNTWVTVESKHQLVSYYMEQINLADEIEMLASDWGTIADGTHHGYIDTSSYGSVSVQIVYEDNSTNPGTTDADALNSKTMIYYVGANGRGVGTMIFNKLANYDIYKVTAEKGEITDSSVTMWQGGTITEFDWGEEDETIIWEGDVTDSVTINNPTNNPSTDPPKDKLTLETSMDAILIRVYVKAHVVATDKLTVHYIDRTDNDNEFYSYEIGVDANTVFDSGFALGDEKNSLVNNTVKNYLGVKQTVLADLSGMAEIGAQYRFSNFECVRVVRSDDGRDVYLYYTFSPVRVVVADFGLPIHILPTDLDSRLEGNVESVQISSAATTNRLGTVSVDGTTVVYTPAKVLTNTDAFTVLVNTKSAAGILENDEASRQVAFRVYIVPASNILYEEGFMSQSGDGVAWSGGSKLGDAMSQSVENEAPYGYDGNYVGSDGPSNSTYSATLDSGDLTKNLTVDFTGTGFDLIGTSSPQTGYVYLVITGDATKAVVIDTSHSSKTLYQVPLAHLELGEGDYTATVFGTYREAIKASGTGVVAVYDTDEKTTTVMTTDEVAGAITLAAGSLVEIDGFRVYSTSNNTAFAAEELGVTYQNILTDSLIPNGFAAYVDNANGNYTVADYEASGGPQNEVYLAKGQSIAMQIEGGAVQISLRSVEEGKTVTAHISNGVTENGDQVASKEINHSTEMYYVVTPSSEGYLTIKNADGGLLAVGNVKYKPAETSFMALGADNWVSLFSLLDEEPVFTPETFDVEIGSVKLFSKKVTTMTITASLDVEYLKVNGKKVKPVNSWMVKRGLAGEYVFVITKTSKKNADVSFDVVAYDATGMASDVYTIEE